MDMREANSTGLDCEIRSCTRCAAVLAAHPENPPTAMRSVVSRPVLSPPMRAPLMLIGQAPGLTEYTTGRPFSGQAGDAIRQLFSSCGVPFMDFDRLVYQTSAVKCFPGRRKNRERWEDRPPCTTMLSHCSDFLARQIEEMQPKIIITLGSVAARALDKLRGIPRRPLSDVVGTTEHRGGTVIVFLAHTSGGSRFLSDESNKLKQERGKAAIASAVQSLPQRRD
jgi:uracil-DNA glycosylase family 4